MTSTLLCPFGLCDLVRQGSPAHPGPFRQPETPGGRSGHPWPRRVKAEKQVRESPAETRQRGTARHVHSLAQPATWEKGIAMSSSAIRGKVAVRGVDFPRNWWWSYRVFVLPGARVLSVIHGEL